MPARSPAFDYATLKPDEAHLARHAADEIREQSALELRAVNAWLVKGALLSQVHGALAHGSWLPWLKAETDISTASAERMIRAADMITGHAKFVTVTNLPPIPATLAYRLSAKQTPQSVRDEFVPRLIDGEDGLAKLIADAIRPEAPVRAADDEGADEPPPVSMWDIKAAMVVVDRIDTHAARRLLEMMEGGETRIVLEALRRRLGMHIERPARFVEPEPSIADDALAETTRARALASLAELPDIGLVAPGISVTGDDDDEDDVDLPKTRLQ